MLGQTIARVAESDHHLRKPAGLLGLDVVAAGCLAWLLSRLGWWREVGFGGPATWRSLPLFIAPVAIGLVSLAGGIVNFDGDRRDWR